VCWLTEQLPSALLANPSESSEALKELAKKLVNAMCVFYEESNAPFELKSVVLTLLSRLFRKLRFMYKQTTPPATQNDSINGMFIPTSFLHSVLSEAAVMKEEEEKISKKSTLYSLFIQDCVEFMTSLMLPLTEELSSYKQLLPGNQDVFPQWLEKLVKVAYFLHNFKGELKLPKDIRDEIVGQMSLDSQWDHLVVIQGIPAQYSCDWVRQKIQEVLNKHKARLMIPDVDLQVRVGDKGESAEFKAEDGTAVILIDGLNLEGFSLDEEDEY